MRRWFLPISGDLRVGGHFQLEGNAGGEILQCEPPCLLRVTFGHETSIVEVRLSPTGDDETAFDLEHTVPVAVAGSAAGSLFVGPGWDLGVFALGQYLQGVIAENPIAAGNSPEGQEMGRQSVLAWVAVTEASGAATAEEIAAATAATMGQFAPDLAAAANGGVSQ